MEGYIVISQIGKGSYGRALKALDKSKNLIVVIKSIDVSVLSNKQRTDALNEVNVLRNIRHPFIVRHFDNFMDKSNLCLTLEFADGGDLAMRISNNRSRHQFYSEPQICRWFTQILLGLSYIHSKNIMHRDLKPQNILIMLHEDRALIGDFGICRVLSSKNELASTMIGTPYYLSPEIFQHRPYSLKSDIWSLGCLLYEMAALCVPFTANDLTSLSSKVCRGSNPVFPARYSSSLRDLFAKLLQRDYRARPSADEVLAMPYIASAVSQLSQHSCEKSRPPAIPRPPSPIEEFRSNAPPLHASRSPRVKVREQMPYSSPRKPISDNSISYRNPCAQSHRYMSPTRNLQQSPRNVMSPGKTPPTPHREMSPSKVIVQKQSPRSVLKPVNSASPRLKAYLPTTRRLNIPGRSVSPSSLKDHARIYPSSPLRQRLNL